MQAGMGTTLVAAVLHNDQWLIANAGDSRAYLVRNGKAQQATRDHSWVAEQMAAGVLTAEEGRNHPYRNIVTRSLGQMPRSGRRALLRAGAARRCLAALFRWFVEPGVAPVDGAGYHDPQRPGGCRAARSAGQSAGWT